MIKGFKRYIREELADFSDIINEFTEEYGELEAEDASLILNAIDPNQSIDDNISRLVVLSGSLDYNIPTKVFHHLRQLSDSKNFSDPKAELVANVVSAYLEHRREVANIPIGSGIEKSVNTVMGEEELDEASQSIRDRLYDAGLIADVLGKNKAGNYVVRKGFFYRKQAPTQEAMAEKVTKAGFKVIDKGEVWKDFRGGASTSRQSHVWVEFQDPSTQPIQEKETNTQFKPNKRTMIALRYGLHNTFDEGYQAAKAGKTKDAHPYNHQSEEEASWLAGWSTYKQFHTKRET